jgi:hexosaminidase
MIQYWFTNIGLPDSLPDEVRAQMDAALARSRRDLETAVRTGVPVIMSPLSNCYLDVPYAEAPAHPAQAERHHRVGLRFYSPMTVEQSYRWEPADALDPSHAAQVAGVEAAIWAETIRDFDDLSFLLLPRLAGVAEKAWAPAHATPWTDHRIRLAQHGQIWAQDDLTYFNTPAVEWC